MKASSPPGIGPTERRARAVAQDAADATYVISVLEGPDAGSSFVLDGTTPTRALLGTSPVCTVRLTDPAVSRRHASLAVTGEHVYFTDLGSTNGTTVNGVLAKEVLLVGGEAIRLGGSVLSVRRGERGQTTSPLGADTAFGRIVGESRAMRRLYPLAQRLVATTAPVLIEGEAGTGKELLAEEIHRGSSRAQGPFMVLESSAIPSDQVGAHLFGAPEDPGLLDRARGGVLFVDEVGDLPRHVQKRLRDFIAASVDVRLVAATRRDLDRDVADGRFDDAFFFALAAGRIELPPLRSREGDVAVLARHFWQQLRPEGAPSDLPVDLLPRFEQYTWPGNVRELHSIVTQRALLGELSRTYLSDRALEHGGDLMATVIQDGLPFPAARDRVLQAFERRYVESMVERYGGNISAAARASGVALRYFQIVRARAK